MPRILRSRTVLGPIVWNEAEQRRAIARHTLPDDCAHAVFRHALSSTKAGTVPLEFVSVIFPHLLKEQCDGRHRFGLISASCANSLKRTLELADVGEYRSRLEVGLVAATYDSWNLPKYFSNSTFLCYCGNFGDAFSSRDLRDVLTVRTDATRHAENRQKQVYNAATVNMQF